MKQKYTWSNNKTDEIWNNDKFDTIEECVEDTDVPTENWNNKRD